MKHFFYVFLFSFFTIQVIAQTPTLTKGETISYLDKKIKESIGHSWTNNNGTIGKISSASVVQSEKGIKIEFRVDYQRTYSYEFNPKLISSIGDHTNGTSSPVNEMYINLKGNVCIFYNNGQTSSVAYSNYPYLKADSENLQKITKAFNHLKALLAAEDDPFGQ